MLAANTFPYFKRRLLPTFFSKFYENEVGVISWFLFHLIWKNYVLYWDFDFEKLNCGFFHSFHSRKKPQNNFSSQHFSLENNCFLAKKNPIFKSLKESIICVMAKVCRMLYVSWIGVAGLLYPFHYLSSTYIMQLLQYAMWRTYLAIKRPFYSAF